MGKRCSFEGCENIVNAHGLCGGHEWQLKHKGVLKPLRKTTSFDWLRAHVGYDGNECLTWPFAKKNGRGSIRVPGASKAAEPARLMCKLAHGEPPTPKHEAAHSCGKGHEGCVNPRHLSWKTHQENMDDQLIHGSRARGETHGNAKLTEAQVIAMRKFAHAVPLDVLAAQFNTTKANAYVIVRRINWRHV